MSPLSSASLLRWSTIWLLTLSIWSATASADPKAAPSEPETTAHLRWIASLDVHDPDKLLVAIDHSLRLFRGTKANERSKRAVWDALLALHKRIIASWSGRIGANRPWAEALDSYLGQGPPQGAPPPLLLSLLAALKRHGALVQRADGSTWLEADIDWLAQKLAILAPSDDLKRARLIGLEQRQPALFRGTLLVSLETLRARITLWEGLIRAHPSTRHAAEASAWIARYLDAYLHPLRYTPGSVRATRLRADRRQSYRRFLAAQPASPQRSRVQAVLAALEASSGESPPLASAQETVDQAVSEVEEMSKKLDNARGDPAKIRAIARAFSDWAHRSDRRLSKVASGLSPDDGRRLSTYAATRLFPQIDALMRRLEQVSDERPAKSDAKRQASTIEK